MVPSLSSDVLKVLVEELEVGHVWNDVAPSMQEKRHWWELDPEL